MLYFTITAPRMKADAMALYPLMLLREDRFRLDQVTITHELIHFRQQIEMLLIFFYLAYGVQYLYNLFKYRDHTKAYQDIMFEREAYAHEADHSYLSKRPFWAWLKS